MGAMFRSEEMALCQLFIQPEAAYTSVAELGEGGMVQFRDMNPQVNAFHRNFVSEVRRCDEMERKLRYISGEVQKDGVHIPDVEGASPSAPNPREIIEMETLLEKSEGEIREVSVNATKLKSDFVALTQMQHVLEKADQFFPPQMDDAWFDNGHRSSVAEGHGGRHASSLVTRDAISFVAGVVKRERMPAFERMLWRITHGNVFVRRTELDEPFEDPITGKNHLKTVFIAFFQGEQLKTRVKKVCVGFHVSLYQCPITCEERDDMMKEVRAQLADLSLVLSKSSDHRQRELASVASELESWTVMVKKMKAIYHTLNLFDMDVSKKCLIGECWVPTADMPNVQKALVEGSRAVGSSIPAFLNRIETHEPPPTFNRTNRFTKGFQNLIDAYGIASYREANPALYTIVTFPFLFAVMFGDLGHGFIMTLFGIFMVVKENKFLKLNSTNEIWNIFFGGRYIILLMGIFSMYTGLVYNDIFGKAMNIFGSSWQNVYTRSTLMTTHQLTLDPKDGYNQLPYFIGVDPVWTLADNKIIFLNSFKMKLSIIIGVVHMIFGVCMSVVNYNYFKNRASIVLEFLPQIIFLLLLFSYMVFMMFYKWILYSAIATEQSRTPGCAPSVLILFINMMLFSTTEAEPGCEGYMFEGQQGMQMVMVFVALSCIPVLLLGKPMYILGQRKKMAKQKNRGKETSKPVGYGGHHDDEAFSEIMINQSIHTIEYVLSTVSHTASYLRLWALSLAHAELAEVLWNMVLEFGLHGHSFSTAIVLYFAFGAWALFTIAILVMMEGLSAFLHTLRLHWVEFMSKFYCGLGYIFRPFSFKAILAGLVLET